MKTTMDLEPAYLIVRTKEILCGLDGVDEVIEPSKLADETLLDDLGVDSLDRVDLAMWLEEEFGIDIDFSKLQRAQYVADVLALVEEQNR